MLDLITVVFREEVDFLRIQATSIQQYFPSDYINSITIVVNDSADVVELVDPAWYQDNQHKVKIKHYEAWGYTTRVLGWENQQLCKLLAAAEADTTYSMVLDAKTWFVKKFDPRVYFDSLGRPCVGTNDIFPVFEPSQRFVEKLYGIKFNQAIGPSGVPFVFHTKTVNDLVHSIDNFADFFQTHVRYPDLVTEFYLYSGFAMAKFGSYNALYNENFCYSTWNIADYQAKDFDLMFDRLTTQPAILTASIHRKTYQHLTSGQLENWVKFLYDRKLICNSSNTMGQLNTYIK